MDDVTKRVGHYRGTHGRSYLSPASTGSAGDSDSGGGSDRGESPVVLGASTRMASRNSLKETMPSPSRSIALSSASISSSEIFASSPEHSLMIMHAR